MRKARLRRLPLDRLAEALVDDSKEHAVGLAVPQQRHVDPVLVPVIQFEIVSRGRCPLLRSAALSVIASFGL